ALTMRGAAGQLTDFVPAEHILTGDAIADDYAHDEALTATPEVPAFVVRPGNTTEVSAVLRIANEHRLPVTARGSGTGLSGAAVPRHDGMVVSFGGMNEIVEVDGCIHDAISPPGGPLQHL